MDCHFIESCEDEWKVLQKIEKLKASGHAESEMFVLARSNEQLTMIRRRSDVEYHAAEAKGMGRFGNFIRGSALPPFFTELTDETRQSAFYYQELLEGKLLLFTGNENIKPAAKGPEEPQIIDRTDEKRMAHLQQPTNSWEEERVTIDSIHYEAYAPGTADSVKRPLEAKFWKRK